MAVVSIAIFLLSGFEVKRFEFVLIRFFEVDKMPIILLRHVPNLKTELVEGETGRMSFFNAVLPCRTRF